MSEPRPGGDDRNRLRYWERLVVMVFGLMLADAGVGGSVGMLVHGGGWFVVAAALGVIEVLIAGYYRARRWIAA